MMRTSSILLISMLLCSCSVMGYNTTGIEGPVAWRVKDYKVEHKRSGRQRQRSSYSFTLVLRERRGIGIRYNYLTYTVTDPGAQNSRPIENNIGWLLPAYGETQIPNLSIVRTRRCPDIGCNMDSFSQLWFVELTGVDGNEKTVHTPIEITFPLDPQAPPSFGTRDLHGADLAGAILSDMNLTGANLEGAVLSRATLRHANLTGSNLNGARLNQADLYQTNLAGADLRKVQALTQDQLNEACIDEKTQLPQTLTRPKPCT